MEAGLDCALVHPKEIVPYFEIDTPVRELCDDLVFNRRPDALTRLIEHFESGTAGAALSQIERGGRDDEDSPIEERIHQAILRRRKDGIEAKIDEALRSTRPLTCSTTILLPAMKDVGDRFGRGELILPFVLQCAEVMKKAVAHLEQFLERRAGTTKGTVVLATVFGDVHDIGKNLVHTILANNGYTVHDLGKQVPDEHDSGEGDRSAGRRDRPLRAARVDEQADADLRRRNRTRGAWAFPSSSAAPRSIATSAGASRCSTRERDSSNPASFTPRMPSKASTSSMRSRPIRSGGKICSTVPRRRRWNITTGAAIAAAPSAAVARSAVKSQRADVPVPPFWGVRALDEIDVRELWPASIFVASTGSRGAPRTPKAAPSSD